MLFVNQINQVSWNKNTRIENNFNKLPNMQIYCLNTINTGNIFPKKLILISKNKIKGKSKCVICLTEKTFINEIKDKYDLESELEVYFQFFTGCCYKTNMLTCCIKFRKNTEHLNSNIFKWKNDRLIMETKCPVCGIKKSRFVKEQEPKGCWVV